MSNRSPFPSPPPELVGEWLCSEDYPWGPLEQASVTITTNRLQNVATQAARWGADQELEATLGLMATLNIRGVDYVRNARRSARAPSLKEQALETLRSMQIDPVVINGVNVNAEVMAKYDTIRRALEQLPN